MLKRLWPSLFAGLSTACLYAAPIGPRIPDEREVRPVTTRVIDDLRIHVVNAGWVRVKAAHRELSGSVATRFPAIVVDREWTELMPVLVAIIEHPDGVFLVDTGLTEEMLDPDYFDCDPATAFVYRHLLDFRMAPEERIDRRLAALGIDPRRVAGIVLTHRHADHTEGLAKLPASAPVYVGAGDWPTHNGALTCRWPSERVPTLVRADEGAPFEAFPHARPLTRDGRVAIVPLVGHSPGHLGVAVRTRQGTIVFGGDATFSRAQIAERKLAGIVEDADATKRTLDILATQIDRYETSLVLAHDPTLLEPFARGERTLLPPGAGSGGK